MCLIVWFLYIIQKIYSSPLDLIETNSESKKKHAICLFNGAKNRFARGTATCVLTPAHKENLTTNSATSSKQLVLDLFFREPNWSFRVLHIKAHKTFSVCIINKLTFYF